VRFRYHLPAQVLNRGLTLLLAWPFVDGLFTGRLKLLASRLRATLPLIGAPMQWVLALLPFMNGWSIYFDPQTKFIIYARKRRAR
jgi:hypothetical protein